MGPGFRQNNQAQKDTVIHIMISSKYIKNFLIINLKILKKYKLNTIKRFNLKANNGISTHDN